MIRSQTLVKQYLDVLLDSMRPREIRSDKAVLEFSRQ